MVGTPHSGNGIKGGDVLYGAWDDNHLNVGSYLAVNPGQKDHLSLDHIEYSNYNPIIPFCFLSALCNVKFTALFVDLIRPLGS